MDEKHYVKPYSRVICLQYEHSLLTGSDTGVGVEIGINDWGDGGDFGGDAN